jgi:predicted deacylase
MRHRSLACIIVLLSATLLGCLILPSQALSKTEHVVHFPNTAYELSIYKIYGKKPGPTLMLIGGIQGNEPGGFLSADLYADMSLEKGNLIVVPRANFYSIIMNERGPNGDMNRKFAHEENEYSMEDKIVTILKKLIGESDYLLNLHDGAGYFYRHCGLRAIPHSGKEQGDQARRDGQEDLRASQQANQE